MAVGEVSHISTFTLRGEETYNYLGNTVRFGVHYNKDNRFPIFPIRHTGDNGDGQLCTIREPTASCASEWLAQGRAGPSSTTIEPKNGVLHFG